MGGPSAQARTGEGENKEGQGEKLQEEQQLEPPRQPCRAGLRVAPYPLPQEEGGDLVGLAEGAQEVKENDDSLE